MLLTNCFPTQCFSTTTLDAKISDFIISVKIFISVNVN